MKNRYFAFFVPSSPIPYFIVRAYGKEDVRYLIDACSNCTDKPTKGEAWYIGELTKSEIEGFCHRCVVL